ncbi:hypothetical protein Tco_0257607 [Tanacetum coccineum]
MASLSHRLNLLFSIKECMSCGDLYTADFCCSKGSLEDKILVPKPPQNCATCGDPVDGLYCRYCAFVRKCLNEVCENAFTFDALSNHFEILSDSNNDGTSSDDDSYENIEYIEASPLNLEYDNNPTPDYVFKSPSSFPIHVVDSDSFFEESDTSLSHLDNSLPKFETFSNHTEEMRSGRRRFTGIVISDNSNDPLLEPPKFESLHFDLYDDPLFPRPPPEPPDVISLIIETDAPVINNFDELNEDECFDLGGDEIDVEDDDSFTFVIQTFLSFLTYPGVSPLLLSTRSEDTIFDPGTDKAKIARKRSKPDKHEHGNGRARKEPGESYQKSKVVNSGQHLVNLSQLTRRQNPSNFQISPQDNPN